ncbi:MAG: N-acetyl-gamma-glutamyl-phosphate reductase, partial [Deferribacteres bacterium]|nr:N-acetyl-gamma-glutamyl-phosphate reductase [Deferribacteres bacterium]
LVSGKKVKIIFTPHLIPANRGILSTMYLRLRGKVSLSAVQKLYRDFYGGEPFVRILKNGVYPSINAVRGSNFCDISVFLDSRGREQSLIIVSAIDNLMKGASAVQNMNIMYGFDETAGLMSPPPSP